MMLAGPLAGVPVTAAGTHIWPPFLKPPGDNNSIGVQCPIFLPDVNSQGRPNFGDGTEYPCAKLLNDNLKLYCRPAKFLLRMGSHFIYEKKSDNQFWRIDFGPEIGQLRTNPLNTAFQRYQLACPFGAAVSRMKDSGESPPDFRFSMGFGFNPRLAVNLSNKGAPLHLVDTYFSVFAAASYYFLDIAGGSTLRSDLPAIGECFPRERYAEIGRCKIDMIDATRPTDRNSLIWDFPIYRDAWFEDGGPSGCVSPSGVNYRSIGCEIRGAFFGWDTTERVAQITAEMQEELRDPEGLKDSLPRLL